MNYRRKEFEHHKRSGSFTLKEGIDAMLQAYRLNGPFYESRVINEWEKIVGTTVATRTQRLWFEGRTLFIRISSAPLKSELNFQKTLLKEKINQYTEGHLVIEELVIL